MSELIFGAISLLVIFVSLICFSCLTISSNNDCIYERHLREKTNTEVIEKIK